MTLRVPTISLRLWTRLGYVGLAIGVVSFGAAFVSALFDTGPSTLPPIGTVLTGTIFFVMVVLRRHVVDYHDEP
jgi:tetrahydromethanopterin S-methyltransferase subunit C